LYALIVEDEVLVAEHIERALREIGYRSFDVAFSAAEAVAFAGRRCPDLITADLRLVDGSGIDAVLEICAERPIPVVFITANGGEIGRRLPDAVIVEKPFEMRTLEAAVARAAAAPFRAPPAP
jgi:DNA-binding response OmpR family regulator